MNLDEARKHIADAFELLLNEPTQAVNSMIPPALTAGKAYEAFVLAEVCHKLYHWEGLKLTLKGGSAVTLKMSPGPINRRYPWIEASRNGRVVAELFTDVEFLSLSYSRQGVGISPGSFHELDIACVKPGAHGRPDHTQIIMGVECKNTQYAKRLLREVLGVRREMSLLSERLKTSFRTWPETSVPANPPSCLLVYSTSESVKSFSAPGATFGISFHHLPM